jgi:transposase-like protein
VSKLGGFPNPTKEEQEITRLEAENKKLRTENQTLQEALAHWQGVVRVAREKDSTLPDPESPSVP